MEVARFLILKHAAVGSIDYINRTPLHYSCLKSHMNAVSARVRTWVSFMPGTIVNIPGSAAAAAGARDETVGGTTSLWCECANLVQQLSTLSGCIAPNDEMDPFVLVIRAP